LYMRGCFGHTGIELVKKTRGRTESSTLNVHKLLFSVDKKQFNVRKNNGSQAVSLAGLSTVYLILLLLFMSFLAELYQHLPARRNAHEVWFVRWLSFFINKLSTVLITCCRCYIFFPQESLRHYLLCIRLFVYNYSMCYITGL